MKRLSLFLILIFLIFFGSQVFGVEMGFSEIQPIKIICIKEQKPMLWLANPFIFKSKIDANSIFYLSNNGNWVLTLEKRKTLNGNYDVVAEIRISTDHDPIKGRVQIFLQLADIHKSNIRYYMKVWEIDKHLWYEKILKPSR